MAFGSKPDPTIVTRVLRLRLKDKHAAALRDKAFWVNQVWNYYNALSRNETEGRHGVTVTYRAVRLGG